jgi:nitrogen fixation-related uncharacterized protein
MADIDIQEKRGQPAWVWVAVAIGVLALIAVIWALTSGRDDRDDTRIRQDTVPAARDTPFGSLDRPHDTSPEFVVMAS